jgi:mycothiol synthase
MLTQTFTQLPIVSGFNFRLARGEEDYPGLVEMINEGNAADDFEQRYTLEDFTHEFNHLPNFDARRDALVIEKGDKIVGVAPVLWRHLDERDWVAMLRLSLAPAARDPQVMAAALKWSEEHAQTRYPGPEGAPRYLQMFTPSTARYKSQLAEEHGYTVARYFYLMLYPSLENLPRLELPDDVELRPAQPEHYRAIWEAITEAFRDHWGHAAQTEQDFERWAHNPHLDPALCRVAWDTKSNEVAGASINTIFPKENEQNGFKRGWIDVLGVRRPWRKRGVASALIADSLKALRDRGMTEGVLGVDAENPTGALRLYEKIGFKMIKKSMAYRKKL